MSEPLKGRGGPAKPVKDLCSCEMLRIMENSADVNDPAVRAIYKQVWTPCRKCHASMGCQICRPREVPLFLCDPCKCGTYTTMGTFALNATPMPESLFESYPAGWRLEYYAVYGAPNPQWLPMIRSHLHSPAAAKRVNSLLRYLGQEEFPYDLAGGLIVDEKGERETVKAREILGDVLTTHDGKAFFKRALAFLK